jgi:hypothetical protein
VGESQGPGVISVCPIGKVGPGGVEQDGPTDRSRGRRVPGENVKQAHYRWPLDRTRDRGHGRMELRILKAVRVSGLGFPDAAQVAQVARKARDLGTRGWQTVTVYAITSLAEPSDAKASITFDGSRCALVPLR